MSDLGFDFCLKWSAEDLTDEGFSTYVLWDLTRPVDPSSDAGVRAELERRVAGILDFASVLI